MDAAHATAYKQQLETLRANLLAQIAEQRGGIASRAEVAAEVAARVADRVHDELADLGGQLAHDFLHANVKCKRRSEGVCHSASHDIDVLCDIDP